jgi:hypothetical protein
MLSVYLNFWMPKPVFMKLGIYIMAPEPISMTYFINHASFSMRSVPYQRRGPSVYPQSLERLEVVNAVNPCQANFLGPAWEFLDAVRFWITATYVEDKEKEWRVLQLTPCLHGSTASVETSRCQRTLRRLSQSPQSAGVIWCGQGFWNPYIPPLTSVTTSVNRR